VRSTTQRRGRTTNPVVSSLRLTHGHGEVQCGRGPGYQAPGVAAVGPDQSDGGEPSRSSASNRWAPSRSWTLAGVTHTASSSPRVSTAMCRLRPLISLLAS